MGPETAALNNLSIVGGAVFSLGVVAILAGRGAARMLPGLCVATAGLLVMLAGFDAYHGGQGGDAWGAQMLVLLAAEAWAVWSWRDGDEVSRKASAEDARTPDSGVTAADVCSPDGDSQAEAP